VVLKLFCFFRHAEKIKEAGFLLASFSTNPLYLSSFKALLFHP